MPIVTNRHCEGDPQPTIEEWNAIVDAYKELQRNVEFVRGLFGQRHANVDPKELVIVDTGCWLR